MESPPVRLPQASCRRASRSEPSADGALERAADVVRRLEPEGDRERAAVAHRAGADRLRERVDAGVRRRPRRQPEREQRVDERVLGAHQPVRDADLAVAVGVGQHRGARDLGAGARRRRAEHERQGRRGERAAALEVVPGRSAGVGEQARGLGEIERRAAADADHGIAVALDDRARDVVGRLEGRLARLLEVALDADAVGGAGRDRGLHALVADDGLLDHDEGALGAERRQHVAAARRSTPSPKLSFTGSCEWNGVTSGVLIGRVPPGG